MYEQGERYGTDGRLHETELEITAMPSGLTDAPAVDSVHIDKMGTFPNNPRLPVLVYRSVFSGRSSSGSAVFERAIRENGWGGIWRNGIYSYHHYHSTAHEVLGVARGSAEVQLGGDRGPGFTFEAGDAVVLPAGVAHKNLGSSSDFLVVGAYPAGQQWDMNYGREEELAQAEHNILQVDLPKRDPLYGTDGLLLEEWLEAEEPSDESGSN